MFIKQICLAIGLLGSFCISSFAADLTLELSFPKQSTIKAASLKPILKPQEVSGSLVIDISPCPASEEKDRYLVEYFLNDQLILSTTGFNPNNPGRPDFSCILDTAKFQNGKYKLIVNFWDEKGPSAIGIKEIIINNKDG